jgi:hypothetical protein
MSQSVIHLSDRPVPVLQRPRLMFGIDATASRQATWTIARDLQAEMFRTAAPIGKLTVKLVYYRGDGECRASKWCSSGDEIARLMNKIDCDGGVTQISRVLKCALRDHGEAPVRALTFIGDAVDGDSIDELAGLASQLGRAGLPVYIFQEGNDAVVRKAFRLVALKSGGAYFEFNPNKPRAVAQLSERLNAVARFAVGDAAARSITEGNP